MGLEIVKEFELLKHQPDVQLATIVFGMPCFLLALLCDILLFIDDYSFSKCLCVQLYPL